MKRLLIILLGAILLTACGTDAEKTKEELVKEDKVEVEKPKEVKPELSESKVSFTNFTIEIEKAEIKDGQLILSTRYNNDSFDGEKSFMASVRVEVKQNGEMLEETTGVETDKNSNYFYKNKTGIDAPVEFNYKLKNETDDVEVTLIPTDFDEDSKTITLTIQ